MSAIRTNLLATTALAAALTLPGIAYASANEIDPNGGFIIREDQIPSGPGEEISVAAKKAF